MASLAHFLFELGTGSFHIFWVPVVCWTVVAVTAVSILRIFESHISPVFHYYGRVTLLWGLLLGVAASLFIQFFPFQSTVEGLPSSKFIVLSRSVITPAAPATALHWTNPFIWLGALTILALAAAALGSIKLIIQCISLRHFTRHLPPVSAVQNLPLTDANRHLLGQFGSVSLHFSAEIELPFTFGWKNRKIILPQDMHGQKQKLNMALRHELMHITNSDYLLNSGVECIKALFYIHPLVHFLVTGIREYRELYCDQHVLRDAMISRKNYAQLLFEISRKSIFKPGAAVNMAVQPSTLKKRIQAMKQSTPTLPSFKWSLTTMIIATLFITGMVACSDVNDKGVTPSNTQQHKQQTESINFNGKRPLVVINGKKVELDKGKNLLNKVDPNDIQAINVLKDTAATDIYGKAGRDGVIQIQLKKGITKDEALNGKSPDGKIYRATEQEPRIKGGLQKLVNKLKGHYPESCKQANVQGRVILNFVINKDGSVQDIKVLRGIGHGCDKAAIKAIKSVQWIPARQGGKVVRAQISWPITFKLPSKNS